MADFTWLKQLDEAAWTSQPGGTARLTISLGELAERSGIPVPDAIAALRWWCFAEDHAAYSFAWCNRLDPIDRLTVVRGLRKAAPAQRNATAGDGP
ncbi:MAG: hypothetical protein ABWY01_05420 [Pseudoxanthomonas sp.]